MRMAISGVCGRMGGTCARIFAEAGETLVFFVDPREGAAPEAVPRFASPADVPAALTCDCMVDSAFSQLFSPKYESLPI